MDDQKFEALMAAINKLDDRFSARSTRIEHKIEKIDDRLRSLEINGAELNTRFDTQFPHIQLRLDQHVSEDTEFFRDIENKVSPLFEQHSNWKKEIWLHRIGIGVLIVALLMLDFKVFIDASKFILDLIK